MNKILSKIVKKIYKPLSHSEDKIILALSKHERIHQLSLINQFNIINQLKGVKNNFTFKDVGFKQYSQNLEDGILLYIFNLIGTHNKICVEMCASNGRQCNSANLIINHGWQGFLFDGDAKLIDEGKKFYEMHPNTDTLPPKLIHAWITAENVNSLLANNRIEGEIELLSLDLDGVDFWILNSINSISPKVILVETQCIWGNEKSVTVPYSHDFKAEFIDEFGIYSGASLPAFNKLLTKKGYRLIGIEPYGFNAFFMRNDIGNDYFPTVLVEDCTRDIPFVSWAQEKFLSLIEKKEWQEV